MGSFIENVFKKPYYIKLILPRYSLISLIGYIITIIIIYVLMILYTDKNLNLGVVSFDKFESINSGYICECYKPILFKDLVVFKENNYTKLCETTVCLQNNKARCKDLLDSIDSIVDSQSYLLNDIDKDNLITQIKNTYYNNLDSFNYLQIKSYMFSKENSLNYLYKFGLIDTVEYTQERDINNCFINDFQDIVENITQIKLNESNFLLNYTNINNLCFPSFCHKIYYENWFDFFKRISTFIYTLFGISFPLLSYFIIKKSVHLPGLDLQQEISNEVGLY